MRRARGAMEAVSGLLTRAAGVALLGMMLAVCYGVVMRYAFRSPVAWVNEFARFSFLPVVALGLAFALRQGAHVATDAVTRALSDRARRQLQVASAWLFLVYAALGCWAGWRLAAVSWAKGLRSDEAEIPLALVQGAIPLGFLALALEALGQVWPARRGEGPGGRPAEGAGSR